MGALATIGHYKPKNLFHIIFDNGSYDSTGGQPTISNTLKFGEIAKGCWYVDAIEVKNKEELTKEVSELTTGPKMLIVKVSKGARSDLGRPTTTPVKNKEKFMNRLSVLSKGL